MLCRRPFVPPGADVPVPCSQCMPCRINRRKLWTSRLLLESMLHSEQCFVTLTYDDEHIPASGNLVPGDAVLWLKRLRKAVYPAVLRYFLVGEYGEKSLRPHYHALLFGIGWNERSVELLNQTWGKGFVQCGNVTPQSIRYTVGYVLKKLTKVGPDGRVPEFARMSRMPGIGHGFVLQVVKSLEESAAARSALTEIPSTVLMGRQRVMLGRYLRDELSKLLGIPRTTPERRAQYIEELQRMLEVAAPGASVVDVVREPNREASVVAREAIFSSRRKL